MDVIIGIYISLQVLASSIFFSCTTDIKKKASSGICGEVSDVEFCKGTKQSGLVSVWQHTLVG